MFALNQENRRCSSPNAPPMDYLDPLEAEETWIMSIFQRGRVSTAIKYLTAAGLNYAPFQKSKILKLILGIYLHLIRQFPHFPHTNEFVNHFGAVFLLPLLLLLLVSCDGMLLSWHQIKMNSNFLHFNFFSLTIYYKCFDFHLHL